MTRQIIVDVPDDDPRYEEIIDYVARTGTVTLQGETDVVFWLRARAHLDDMPVEEVQFDGAGISLSGVHGHVTVGSDVTDEQLAAARQQLPGWSVTRRDESGAG